MNKYLEEKLELIRASISGSIMGIYMFEHLEQEMDIGEKVQKNTDLVMEHITKEIKNIYKYNSKKNT